MSHHKSLTEVITRSAGHAAGRRIVSSGIAEDVSVGIRNLTNWTARYLGMAIVLAASLWWENYQGSFITATLYVFVMAAWNLALNDGQRLTIHHTKDPFLGGMLFMPLWTLANWGLQMYGLILFLYPIGFAAWVAIDARRVWDYWHSKKAANTVNPRAKLEADLYNWTYRFTKAPKPDAPDALIKTVNPHEWVTATDDGTIALRFADEFDLSSDTMKAKLLENLEARMKRRYAADWHPTGYVDTAVFTPRPEMPKNVEFKPKHRVGKDRKPDLLQLWYGINEDGGQLFWNTQGGTPHGIISGGSGGGKTATLRTLAGSALVSGWYLHTADGKGMSFNYLKGRERCTINSKDNVMSGVQKVHDIMEARYAEVDREEKYFTDYTPHLLIVDEVTNLLRSDEGDEFVKLLAAIAEKGREARIFLMMGMQFTYSKGKGADLPGDLKGNASFRLGMGAMSRTHADMIFNGTGVELAQKTENTPGRAVHELAGKAAYGQVAWFPDLKDRTLDADVKASYERFLPPVKAIKEPTPAPSPAPSFTKPTETPQTNTTRKRHTSV